ncbi:LPS export ABC transporter periplasmic protein LptC [Candidatus Pelagibacter ubique]|uniref:LPS export ABC transporter periplasmic protein LptC n=1 Tax=Pelagibacter ubique TaxID=198252 RepID=UPI0003C7F6E6
MKKKIVLLFIVVLFSIILNQFYFKNIDKDKLSISNENLNIKIEKEKLEEKSYSSNTIENVKYSSSDPEGNEYTIIANEGEIDIKNSQTIFLKNVKASIKLKNSDIILISSGFAKYDAANLDTIFTENVVIENLENKIIGEYLDFSMLRKNIIISKNVVFNNNTNVLKTDVIEIDIETKNTKFYMYEKNKKVSIVKTN